MCNSMEENGLKVSFLAVFLNASESMPMVPAKNALLGEE